MTKQKEIREVLLKQLTKLLGDVGMNQTIDLTPYITNILFGLDKGGVVIKVDCSECEGDGRVQKFFDRTFSNRCPKCNGYGYVAVEPLVEENIVLDGEPDCDGSVNGTLYKDGKPIIEEK